MKRLGLALLTAVLLAALGTACNDTPQPCASTVSSLSAVQGAVSAASPGQTVCLADGTYGKLTVNASKSGRVNIQAEHPGQATLSGASLNGSHLVLSRFKVLGDEVTCQPGSTDIVVHQNLISGGYFGVDCGPTSSTNVNDPIISGNRFVGPFGEDAIRANRYHDTADPDSWGLLVIGNEFSNIRENGNHSDCFQSVWGGDHLAFIANYLHDNQCQGFFVKDQPASITGITVDDNLFLRNSAGCGPPATSCGQPAYLQIFGPYTGLSVTRNTMWPPSDVLAAFQSGSGADTVIAHNAIYRFWTSTAIGGSYFDNTVCKRESAPGGSWPTPNAEVVNCSPSFANPAIDDYRLGNGRGVDWAPAEQHYGP